MNEAETQAAVAHIRHDWSNLRNPPGGGHSDAVPGAMPTIDPRYAGQGCVPYWPRGENQPVVTDNQGWNRTRFLDATAVGRSIVITFEWPSDRPTARTYLLVVDGAEWSVDDRLTSTVIWAQVAELLGIPDWTTTQCVPVSARLSIVLPRP